MGEFYLKRILDIEKALSTVGFNSIVNYSLSSDFEAKSASLGKSFKPFFHFLVPPFFTLPKVYTNYGILSSSF